MKIAVVIPCYKVCSHVAGVIAKIGDEVSAIYCVDDACPESSGDYIQKNVPDSRVVVLRNSKNLGVGGAVMAGYRQAIQDGMDIIVKVDGDGQMDPGLIGKFTAPLIRQQADYTKGNRFYSLELTRAMPMVRKIGNFGLSFLCKLSSGYWNIFDPTNGYTAISAKVAAELPLDKISERFFFESDMLYHLGTIRAVTLDIPMQARYGSEKSNLHELPSIITFFLRHMANTGRRIFYTYFLRDFSIASLELALGLILFIGGMYFGLEQWRESIETGITASAGTVMAASLPVILGFQMLLSFLNYDMTNVPKTPMQQVL